MFAFDYFDSLNEMTPPHPGPPTFWHCAVLTILTKNGNFDIFYVYFNSTLSTNLCQHPIFYFILYFLFRSMDVSFWIWPFQKYSFLAHRYFTLLNVDRSFFFLPSDLLNVLTFWLCRHHTCLRQTNPFLLTCMCSDNHPIASSLYVSASGTNLRRDGDLGWWNSRWTRAMPPPWPWWVWGLVRPRPSHPSRETQPTQPSWARGHVVAYLGRTCDLDW